MFNEKSPHLAAEKVYIKTIYIVLIMEFKWCWFFSQKRSANIDGY